MKRSFQAIGVTILLSLLPALTSSGVLAAPSPKTENLDSLGTSEANEEFSAGLSAEVHSAEKNESESLLSVTWSIKNEGEEDVFFNWPVGITYSYTEIPYSGVTMTTADGSTRFHPVMDSDGACLCSGISSHDFKDQIGPGEQVAYWSMFPVPTDADEIHLEIPGFDPVENIPIS